MGGPSGRELARGTLPRPRIDLAAASAKSTLSQPATFAPPAPLLGPAPPKSYSEAIRFLMHHATNGFAVPDYLEALAMGYEDWVEWQLDYLNIDDSAVEDALLAYPTLTMTNEELYLGYTDDPATVVYELQQALLLRSRSGTVCSV